jgi:hypothetical protein
LLRAHWTPDFTEAHIVETMLRAHDIPGWVFDGGIVRQDWFKTLALGGYRVMVPDEHALRARELTAAYRSGALSLADDEVERPACPRCDAGRAVENLWPRRIVFLLLIASNFGLLFASLLVIGSVGVALLFAFTLIFFFPGVLGYLVKWRYRCSACATTWRAPPRRAFADLARAVDAQTPAASP